MSKDLIPSNWGLIAYISVPLVWLIGLGVTVYFLMGVL